MVGYGQPAAVAARAAPHKRPAYLGMQGSEKPALNLVLACTNGKYGHLTYGQTPANDLWAEGWPGFNLARGCHMASSLVAKWQSLARLKPGCFSPAKYQPTEQLARHPSNGRY